MKQTSTLQSLTQFVQEEEEMILSLGLKKSNEQKQFAPKQSTINNILSFSKAYSVKKSKNVGHIEQMLN
jgi:hypothetical protein